VREEELFPVFTLENETGELSVIYDMKELLCMVEEFWDILKDDFTFWDATGYPLEFEQSFLVNRGGIRRSENNESQMVRSLILKGTKDVGLQIESQNATLIDLYERGERGQACKIAR